MNYVVLVWIRSGFRWQFSLNIKYQIAPVCRLT